MYPVWEAIDSVSRAVACPKCGATEGIIHDPLLEMSQVRDINIPIMEVQVIGERLECMRCLYVWTVDYQR